MASSAPSHAVGAPLDIEKTVTEFGTEAVKRYRTLAATRRDNEVPPSFLRSQIALALSERFGGAVHIDRPYSVLALELGLTLTPDLLMVLGSGSADVAMYADGRPTALIKLEIFDQASILPAIGAELHKAHILRQLSKVSIYLGVMVCPVAATLEARIERLHAAMSGNLYVGERQLSHDDRWSWCFACGSLE